MNGRRAFRFAGGLPSVISTGISKANSMFSVIDIGMSALDFGSKLITYGGERRITAELRSQIRAQEEMLDIQIEEARRQGEIIIKEARERAEIAISSYKVKLLSIEEALRKEMELMEKKAGIDYDKYLTKFCEQQDLLNIVQKSIDTQYEILVGYMNCYENDDYLLSLQEEFRQLIRTYTLVREELS